MRSDGENFRGKALTSRFRLAALLALIALLQLVAAGVQGSKALGGVGATKIFATDFGVGCEATARGERKIPLHETGRSQCCVFCNARDFDEPTFIQPSHAGAPILSQLHAAIFVEGWFSDSPEETPFGCRGAWSSRAPPLSV
jgi:hypothetical protein